MSEFKVGNWVEVVAIECSYVVPGDIGVIKSFDYDGAMIVSFPSKAGRLHNGRGEVSDSSCWYLCSGEVKKAKNPNEKPAKKLIWSEPFALTLDNIQDVVDALKDGRGVETTYSHCPYVEFREFAFGDDLFEEGDYYRIQIPHTLYEGEIEVNGRKIKVREVED